MYKLTAISNKFTKSGPICRDKYFIHGNKYLKDNQSQSDGVDLPFPNIGVPEQEGLPWTQVI